MCLIESANIKDEARRLIEELPEEATWDALMYKICSPSYRGGGER